MAAPRIYRRVRGIKSTIIGVPERQLNQVAERIHKKVMSLATERIKKLDERSIPFTQSIHKELSVELENLKEQEKRSFAIFKGIQMTLDRFGIYEHRKEIFEAATNMAERIYFRNDAGIAPLKKRERVADLRALAAAEKIIILLGKKSQRFVKIFASNMRKIDNGLGKKLTDLAEKDSKNI